MKTRRLRNERRHGIKGPVFDSMRNQNDGPQRRLVWAPGTQSLKQRKKNMRQRLKQIIDSKDPIVISVGDRVIRSVCDEPDPEFSALHLFCAALDAHNDTGEPWHVCMTYLMDKFDETAREVGNVVEEFKADGQTKPEGSGISATIGRLLRSLVPRSLRKGDARASQDDVDQSNRDAAGEHRDANRSAAADNDSGCA